MDKQRGQRSEGTKKLDHGPDGDKSIVSLFIGGKLVEQGRGALMPSISYAHKWDPAEIDKMDPIGAIDYLVIHHTESGDVSVDDIDHWHKSNKWIGVGYHYIIRASGAIEKGRPDNKMGAHAQGHNQNSLGIALTGDFTNITPFPAQMDSLVSLLKELCATYPGAKVVKHKDLCQTSCPGDSFPWDELTNKLGDFKMDQITIKIGATTITGQLEGGTSTGPVRAIAEAMGGAVAWDDATKTVTVTPLDDRYKLYSENQRLRQVINQAYGVLGSASLRG